jgi:hypothetical protein
LTFLDALGGRVLELGFFLGIAWSKWHRSACSEVVPFKSRVSCWWEAALPCAMVGLIGIVYFLSRHSAKVELSIAEKLFPEGRLPDRWIGPRDPAGITISVMAFFALYIVLAFVSDNIRLVSLLMFVIACIDFNTRRLINLRVDAYFKDSRYAPHVWDPNYTLMLKMRDVIWDHLYRKPHLWKEAARAGGCVVAFGVALIGARSIAYLILMATLVVNEIITWHWRAERDSFLVPLLDPHEAIGVGNRRSRRSPSFSLTAWAVSTLYMALAAYVAWQENTFTSKSVTLGFVNHGGMWGDFLILPLVNGLIVPYIPRITFKRSMVACGFLACAVILTLLAHRQWAAFGEALGTTDFVFPNHSVGVWYNDLSVSGYMHIVYMSLELTLIFIYAVISIPVPRIFWISSLLTMHLVLGQVQPSWYTTGTIWNARTIVPTLTSILLIWSVSLYKIRHERFVAVASSGDHSRE